MKPKAKNAEWDESYWYGEDDEWQDHQWESEEYEASKGKKEKGKDLSLKESPRVRMYRDRLLQGHHSLHLRKETDPNPKPNPKHAPA